jgi:hypothetical protein
MKRSALLLGVWLTTLPAACDPGLDLAAEPPPTGPRIVGDTPPPLPLPEGATLQVDPNRQLLESGIAPGRTGVFSITDSSGALETKIWSCSSSSPVAHPVVQCTVDPDYVLVGGGAWAKYTGPGALLTASYPADPNTLRTWEGRSKDHGVSDPHILTVYAIGLKISGVSRSTLLGYMTVTQRTSEVAAYPMAGAASTDDIALSGGARDNWTGPGNMLTRVTYGDAAGKEHGWPDPSTITHYVISIAPLVGTHQLEGGGDLTQVSGSGGVLTAQATITSGYVPTGVSGFSIFNGAGRILTRVAPISASQFVAQSKDHLVADGGQLFVIISSLRQKP